ncbi:MAG: LCP family protein [Bacilli bacterium]
MKKIKLYMGFNVILIACLVISYLSLTYSIYLLTGVETVYRTLVLLILLPVVVFLIITLIDSIRFVKYKRFVVSGVVSIILSIIFIVLSVIILNLYGKIDNISTSPNEYSTSLIAIDSKYKDINSIKKVKIGIIDDQNDIENYILPKEVIEKNKLEKDNEIITFGDSLSLIKALYDKKIDSAFISSNYKDMFSTIEEYKDIDKKVHVVFNYNKIIEKVPTNEDTNTSAKKLTEPFTVLILGVDSEKEGLAANASFNGDTIMLITFNPKTMNATMFSIPRDTYVKMGCGGGYNKINAAAWGGTSCMIRTIENFTGLKIDYHVKINFKGVVELVDSLGGIYVDVPKPDLADKICEQDSNRDYGKGLICIEPGPQTINGEQALALARHRHTFSLGDFTRGQNQQLVVEGIAKKAKTVTSVKKFYSILDTISKNMETNMSSDDILSLYSVAKKMMFSNDNNLVNIEKSFLRGYSLSPYIASMDNTTYTFQNFKGSLDEIVKMMKINLGLLEAPVIKTFSFSANELYERKIAGDKQFNEPRRQLLPEFTSNTEAYAKSWCSNNGLSLKIEYIDQTDPRYNKSMKDGQVISQSIHSLTFVPSISSSINLVVVKTKASIKPDPIVPTDPVVPGEITKPDDTLKPGNGKDPNKPKE